MKPIVVGIDGSLAAIKAALWGVDEAISRSVPLRLVSVLKSTHLSPDEYERDLEHAEISLREARSAVEADGRPVKIETETPRGPAGPVLVEASHDAEMICVGSVGIGRYARSILGSTATELAEKAHCPVAVLRTDSDVPSPVFNWIVVRMTDAPGNDAVVEYAAWEAKLRRAPMLVLEDGRRSSPSTRTARSNVGCRIGASVIPRCASTRSPPRTVSPVSCTATRSGFSSRSSVAPRPVSWRASSGLPAIRSSTTRNAQCSSFAGERRAAGSCASNSPARREICGINRIGFRYPRIQCGSRATITGTRAIWATVSPTEPTSSPANPPRPRLPTTTS